ncbi:MAG: NAD-dependent epimerase/dehydratase family protein [Burkholderiaceae bacterium]
MTHRVLVTGANGYVGRALSRRLCSQLADGVIQSLTLVDQHSADDDGLCESLPANLRDQLHQVIGDLRDPDTLAHALAQRPDRVFHLAGITSRQAEDDFALGLAVNVDAAMALFEQLREQQLCPVLVFASSCGVYGPPMPSVIDDATVPAPRLSYGSQKLMVEILLSDYSRRGWLDARSVRLPSVVARPAPRNAAASSFASDLLRETALGRRYVCPVGPDASLWLLSLPICVTQLLHAAGLPAQALPQTRAWNLPALQVTADEVVRAMAQRLGCDPNNLVHYQPQPAMQAMQAQFAQWPPLSTRNAQAMGFTHDGTLAQLLDNALAPSTPFATFPSTSPAH